MAWYHKILIWFVVLSMAAPGIMTAITLGAMANLRSFGSGVADGAPGVVSDPTIPETLPPGWLEPATTPPTIPLIAVVPPLESVPTETSAPPQADPAATTAPPEQPSMSAPPAVMDDSGGDGGGPGKSVFAAIILALTLLTVIGLRVRSRSDPKRLADGSDRAAVRDRWGDRCAYRWVMWGRCDGPLEYDHQVAHSRGGRTKPRNLQPICARHHRPKGATPNRVHVFANAVPVIGHAIYAQRWIRAELLS